MSQTESTDRTKEFQATWDSINQRYPGENLLSIYRKFDLEASPVSEESDGNLETGDVVIFRKLLGHSLRVFDRFLRRFPDGGIDQEDLVQNIIFRNWDRLNSGKDEAGAKDRNREPVLVLGTPLSYVKGGLQPFQDPLQTVIDLETREIIAIAVPNYDSDTEIEPEVLEKLKDALTLSPEEIQLKESKAQAEKQAHLEKGRQRFYGHIQKLDLKGIFEFVKTISRDNLPDGIDTLQLDYLLQTYRLPPFLKFFHTGNRYLDPVKRRFAELSLAMQFSPTEDRGVLNLNGFREMTSLDEEEPTIIFKQLPDEFFSADRLLIACLASSGEEILYPHLDEERKVIATSQFRATRVQKYFIERKAREVLAQSKLLRMLYPSRAIKDASFSQYPDGELHHFDYFGINRGKYKNAVMHFPVGTSGKTINLAVAEVGRPNEAAHYRHSIEAIAFIEGYLKKKLPDNPENRQEIKNTGLHEKNHASYYHLSPDQQAEVVDMFDSSDRQLLAFAQSLSSLHIDIALDYLKSDPSAESITIKYNGSDLQVAKRSIILELIAFATEEANTPRYLKSKMIDKPRVIAGKCIKALSLENQQKLSDYNLMTDAESFEFKEFFLAFEQALSILAPEYVPNDIKELQQKTPALTEIGSNRFRKDVTARAGILMALVGLGLSIYSLTHGGVGLTRSDGSGFNLRVYSPSVRYSGIRIEWQNISAIDFSKPGFDDVAEGFVYPRIIYIADFDLTAKGIGFSKRVTTDYQSKNN